MKFIPLWVKVAVAMALGLGTMVGWKCIVGTVGEKIGKDHLTYGQGTAAEITAMVTIGAADWFGLEHHPRAFIGYRRHDGGKSHGLTVGYGAQSAHGLGVDFPASMILAGFLFWGFTNIF